MYSLLVVLLCACRAHGWAYSVLPSDTVSAVYRQMGYLPAKAGEELPWLNWRVKLEYEGQAVSSALTRVMSDRFSAQGVNVPIVIFGSIGGNGGSLFSAALKLVKKGYRKITIYYVLNYLSHDPTKGTEYTECYKILEKLRSLDVEVFRFTTNEEINLAKSVKTNATPNYDRTEKELKESVKTAKILLDGLVGTGLQRITPEHREKMQVSTAAIETLATVANEAKSYGNGLVVIVNDIPSGMDKFGVWLSKKEFKFDILFSMGFNKTFVNTNQSFAGVETFVLFFKPPLESFYEALGNMIKEDNIVVNKRESDQLRILKSHEDDGHWCVKVTTSAVIP